MKGVFGVASINWHVLWFSIILLDKLHTQETPSSCPLAGEGLLHGVPRDRDPSLAF